ncbi:MAG: hypothetical protein HKN29_10410 [Rhodothermales bacterium]|nr:hypothetical protein [Rhodothermales bacterium]
MFALLLYMKRISVHTEDADTRKRRRALGRAFFDLRRGEREDTQRQERPAVPKSPTKAKRSA